MSEKETPLTVQYKPKLGRAGLFVIAARVLRNGVEQEETIMTLRPDQAIALGGVLISEGRRHDEASKALPQD